MAQSRLRLLVVESDEAFLRKIIFALNQAGHLADGTTDSRLALRWIGERKRDWNLVITDLEMPYVRGYAIVSAAKICLTKAMTIIFSQAPRGRWVTQDEPDAFVQKSENVTALVHLVGQLQRTKVNRPMAKAELGLRERAVAA